jgi:hypothetical protein
MHAIAYRYNLESFNNIWLANNQRDVGMELRNTNEFILPLVRRKSFRKSLYIPYHLNETKVVLLNFTKTGVHLRLHFPMNCLNLLLYETSYHMLSYSLKLIINTIYYVGP